MTTPDAIPTSLQLAIERRQDPQGVLLVLDGEIDLASAAELERAIVEELSAGPADIVIDLAGVEFIDSSGLRTLMVSHGHAKSTGRSLILRNIRPQARRLFELTGTADAFITD